MNYGKVAKRMYNIFRLTGRYQEAAYLRELFDEPTTMLYQVWSLIRTIDDISKPDTEITIEQTVLPRLTSSSLSVIKALEGDQEAEIVRLLLRLRDGSDPAGARTGTERVWPRLRAAEVINLVNNFFFERLTAVPEIKDYMDCIVSE